MLVPASKALLVIESIHQALGFTTRLRARGSKSGRSLAEVIEAVDRESVFDFFAERGANDLENGVGRVRGVCTVVQINRVDLRQEKFFGSCGLHITEGRDTCQVIRLKAASQEAVGYGAIRWTVHYPHRDAALE